LTACTTYKVVLFRP